mgnify:FL=1
MDIQDGLKDISSHSKKKRKVGKQVIGKVSSKRVHNIKCKNEFKRLNTYILVKDRRKEIVS